MGLRHLRFRISGLLFASGQTWSIGINFLPALGTPAQDVPISSEVGLAGWTDAVKALHNGTIVPDALRAGLSNRGTITTLRAADVNPAGKEEVVSILELGAPIAGTGNPIHPGQVACAVTTLTGRPGASNRGRFYWPGIGYGVGSDGRIGSIDPNALAAGAAQFIADLEAAGGLVIPTGIGAFVVSNTKQTANRIQSVAVGNRLDIQRRRADKEKDVYSMAVVPD